MRHRAITQVVLLACLIGPSVSHAEEPFAGAPSRFALFDGIRIHYKVLGKGEPTLVLVHGWSCNLGFWRGQGELARTMRLILVDLPGHGKSDKPAVTYSIDRFARAVAAVLRDAKVKRAVLAGHSMGTPVVWQFYRLFPERVRALVAVDGSFRPFVTTSEDRDRFAARYRGPGYQAAMTTLIDNLLGQAAAPTLREEVKAEMLKTPQHVVASAAHEMTEPTVFTPDTVKVPVLAVYTNRPFWSAEYRKAIEAFLPRLDYQTMDGVGHFLMLEKPEVFNDILVGFMRRQGLLSP